MSAKAPTQEIAVPPALIASAAALGPWGLVGGLALAFGLPFAEHLISNAQNNVPVNLDEWNKLRAKNARTYDELPGGTGPA